ncbi:Uncharacterised protein [Mycobacterium tuberculosis]|uniref:Uncharacterized protein n=1 Tax=Mycobacterium tuberculosis TaxID=1773 RepID=A0A916LCC0_MYCTX|nr:Uncharacterised protein [Mycobacterium tuberculosis]COX79739.1 Uncharacterised protein [Mycobacterium tuberculosis]COY38985.1 Uncharacterised protein [Mycobacterium tuberculosis]
MGHGVVTSGTKRLVVMPAISSGSRVKCRLRGTTPCFRARTTLISPSTPAVDWVCPKLVFTDASAHGPSTPYTSETLAYSMGSPIGVPGPCASTMPTVAASTPPAANAAR